MSEASVSSSWRRAAVRCAAKNKLSAGHIRQCSVIACHDGRIRRDVRTSIGKLAAKFVRPLDGIPNLSGDRVHASTVERLHLIHGLVRELCGLGIVGG